MPKVGDSYIVTLLEAHLSWGIHRNTSTRNLIYGEGYIKIPANIAHQFEIYNSNNPRANTEYLCTSNDGFLSNAKVKASGSSQAGDPYAKQFQGSGDLQLIGGWYKHINAQVGDQIEIIWQSSTAFTVKKIC